MDERREALAQAQGRGRLGDRQEAPVALDEDRPAGRSVERSSVVDRVEGRVDAGRGQARPELVEGQGRGDEPAALGGLDLDLVADQLLGQASTRRSAGGAPRRARPQPARVRRPAGSPAQVLAS